MNFLGHLPSCTCAECGTFTRERAPQPEPQVTREQLVTNLEFEPVDRALARIAELGRELGGSAPFVSALESIDPPPFTPLTEATTFERDSARSGAALRRSAERERHRKHPRRGGGVARCDARRDAPTMKVTYDIGEACPFAGYLLVGSCTLEFPAGGRIYAARAIDLDDVNAEGFRQVAVYWDRKTSRLAVEEIERLRTPIQPKWIQPR